MKGHRFIFLRHDFHIIVAIIPVLDLDLWTVLTVLGSNNFEKFVLKCFTEI